MGVLDVGRGAVQGTLRADLQLTARQLLGGQRAEQLLRSNRELDKTNHTLAKAPAPAGHKASQVEMRRFGQSWRLRCSR
ncbi:hypothetical protein [Nonomuraea sp. NPDC003709]|uniref:hypothetical protein n=1 Tax=Nonomuraea sp. NPDC003709 TaxID=3154450 RepID=UPI00339F12C2